MKQLLALVGMVAVVTTASATSVQIPVVAEYVRSPLGGLGREIVQVRIYDNGDVLGYRSGDRRPAEWKKIETLSAFEMTRLRTLVARAARSPGLVAPVGDLVNCAAVPMNQDVYRAPLARIVLEQNTNPCGATQYNDTRSSLEIVQKLNAFRNRLYALDRE